MRAGWAQDPRAHDLLRADPDRIDTLAGFLRQAAERSLDTSAGLRGAAHDTVWRGPAADTFRHSIGAMPGRLDGLHAGFRDASAALTAFADVLVRLQSAHRRTSAHAQDLQAELPGARHQAEAARAAMRRAIYAPVASPERLAASQREADRAQRQLSELEDEVAHAHRRLAQLIDAFAGARSDCRLRIDAARRLAPPPAPSPRDAWFTRDLVSPA